MLKGLDFSKAIPGYYSYSEEERQALADSYLIKLLRGDGLDYLMIMMGVEIGDFVDHAPKYTREFLKTFDKTKVNTYWTKEGLLYRLQDAGIHNKNIGIDPRPYLLKHTFREDDMTFSFTKKPRSRKSMYGLKGKATPLPKDGIFEMTPSKRYLRTF